jgi:hypothetical protein
MVRTMMSPLDLKKPLSANNAQQESSAIMDRSLVTALLDTTVTLEQLPIMMDQSFAP